MSLKLRMRKLLHLYYSHTIGINIYREERTGFKSMPIGCYSSIQTPCLKDFQVNIVLIGGLWPL